MLARAPRGKAAEDGADGTAQNAARKTAREGQGLRMASISERMTGFSRKCKNQRWHTPYYRHLQVLGLLSTPPPLLQNISAFRSHHMQIRLLSFCSSQADWTATVTPIFWSWRDIAGPTPQVSSSSFVCSFCGLISHDREVIRLFLSRALPSPSSLSSERIRSTRPTSVHVAPQLAAWLRGLRSLDLQTRECVREKGGEGEKRENKRKQYVSATCISGNDVSVKDTAEAGISHPLPTTTKPGRDGTDVLRYRIDVDVF